MRDGSMPDGQARPRPPLRVVLVDEHRMFVDAVAAAFAEQPDLWMAGTFTVPPGDLSDRSCLADRVVEARPDLLVLDVAPFAPQQAGPFVADVARRRPGLGVVVLTDLDDPAQAAALVRVGVSGWVAKQDPTAELLAVVRAVGRGHARLPEHLLGAVLRDLVQRPPAGPAAGPLTALSGQELRVLAALAAGGTGSEIAARLHLSAGTVRTHTHRIYGKLGVHSRLEAVALARRAGLSVATERDPTS